MDRTTCMRSSADFEAGGRQEGIDGDLQVLRRRTFADAAGGIVLRAVAVAEPAAEIALMRGGRAAQMGADARDDQPFGLAGGVARGGDAVGGGGGGAVGQVQIAGD